MSKFRAHADARDFDDHLDWLMAEAERIHKLGIKAYAVRQRANAQYSRCYREMEQIVEEMKKTRDTSEKLFP